MSNAYQVVRDFEQSVADFAGAPYAVAVESCSAALFLSFLYCKAREAEQVIVPSITYPSVPASVINAGGRVRFENIDWQKTGWYAMRVDVSRGEEIDSGVVIDSAKYLERGMWKKISQDCFTYACLSFHGKKHLKIGRGGMILTDNKEAVEWFKMMRFDGRHEAALPTDTLQGVGWNMYLSPEQAARGLEQLQWIGDGGVLPLDPYQNLSQYKFYTEANR